MTKWDIERLNRVRSRAIENNLTAVTLIASYVNYRQMIRFLNDRVGMLNYELAKCLSTEDGLVDLEVWVPSDLAIIVKCTFSG